jgi:hypothetical protein
VLNIKHGGKNNKLFLVTNFDSLIKKYKRKETDKLGCLLRTSHANIVNLFDAFLNREIIHFAYEVMEVSLRELSSCAPLGHTGRILLYGIQKIRVRPFKISKEKHKDSVFKLYCNIIFLATHRVGGVLLQRSS